MRIDLLPSADGGPYTAPIGGAMMLHRCFDLVKHHDREAGVVSLIETRSLDKRPMLAEPPAPSSFSERIPSRGNAKFSIDRPHMAVHGVGRQVKLAGDVPLRERCV